MEIRTLEGCSPADLALAFNAAFIDYKISMHFSAETMETKMRAENIKTEYSAGVFDGKTLVAFILTATDTIGGRRLAYNAGTGVQPFYRGRSLTKKMYAFIIPLLKAKGISNHVLEVFADNTPAKSVYLHTGFTVTRNLDCYKGTPIQHNDSLYPVREIAIDEINAGSFWDISPTWQNGMAAIARNLQEHRFIGIKVDQRLHAYAIYTPHNGRVKQVAVDPAYRRQGMATQLLKHISKSSGTDSLLATGVEENEGLHAFFTRMGLQPFLPMHEMEMNI